MIEGIVLAALPSSFGTFVTVWKGIGESERTLSNLFNRILAEIEDNKLFHVREDKALLIRGRRTGNKRQSNFVENKAPVKPNSSNQKYGQLVLVCLCGRHKRAKGGTKSTAPEKEAQKSSLMRGATNGTLMAQKSRFSDALGNLCSRTPP